MSGGETGRQGDRETGRQGWLNGSGQEFEKTWKGGEKDFVFTECVVAQTSGQRLKKKIKKKKKGKKLKQQQQQQQLKQKKFKKTHLRDNVHDVDKILTHRRDVICSLKQCLFLRMKFPTMLWCCNLNLCSRFKVTRSPFI